MNGIVEFAVVGENYAVPEYMTIVMIAMVGLFIVGMAFRKKRT